ncbi:hypothetical protein B0H10DRAFT_2186634 [Mycena sp. CBHHK59/15]|nr:hypothetical protein B0H10DRAFT_2186634 [Mycena sp. CBHHK59/15]
MAPSKHTPAEQEFLEGLTGRQVKEFRNFMYTGEFIALNAARFLDHEWIDIPTVKTFLSRHESGASDPSSTRSSVLPDPAPSPLVKTEPVHDARVIVVKSEPQLVHLPGLPAAPVKIQALYEGGREVLEILSDSETEPEPDPDDSDIEEVSGELTRQASRSSSIIPPPDVDTVEDKMSSSSDSDVERLPVQSDTLWQDPITSYVRVGNFNITKKVKVSRIEYISELASVYPVFLEPTAIVVDLSHPKFDLEHPQTKRLYAVDHLIRNSDNDGWENTGSGTGSSKPWVSFVPGEPRIQCRRTRGVCRGACACQYVDPTLLNVVRYELDPTSRQAVLSAQADTRRTDGTTPEQNAAIFKKIVSDSKCMAIDANGNKCKGGPILKAKPGGQSRGHQYFVACSGWRPNFKENHRTPQIPDHVDEDLLAKAFAGQLLSADDDKNTAPCSRLVHTTTGLKQQWCPHAHIIDGKEARGRIRRYPCNATQTIYVPLDPTIRKALIISNNTGHNHPLPILKKVSLPVQEKYRECVAASGCVGATVLKVDNAPSTKLIFNGDAPAALASRRVKRDIVRQTKGEKYPHGLGIIGAYELYRTHLTKPLPEKYLHAYITTPDGGTCILTCVVYLLKLLDDPGVNAFDGDTTYRRVEGEMNEWELTVFAKIVLRAATVARAYINRASTDFFEQLFDALQNMKLTVTGKPIPLKRFVPGGNIEVMNADMDGAQALGFCRAVMKHNVPEYSGIPNDTPPEEIAAEFIKLCWRHGKEPVNDFKGLVTPAQFKRISDFVYIDSKEALDAFSTFVQGLDKKIQDWWAHKKMHAWIIPCLVKSQSRIPADVWDRTPSTTNTNEAQHHWTNAHTGTKLTLVEAIETAFILDKKTADEIQTSLRTGILTNAHNEVAHRMSRNSQRQSRTAKRVREAEQRLDQQRHLKDQIAEEAEARRQSTARTKDLNAQLKAMKTLSKGKGSTALPIILSASSSGRVTTAKPGRKASRSKSSASGSTPAAIPDAAPAPPVPSEYAPFGMLGDASLLPSESAPVSSSSSVLLSHAPFAPLEALHDVPFESGFNLYDSHTTFPTPSWGENFTGTYPTWPNANVTQAQTSSFATPEYSAMQSDMLMMLPDTQMPGPAPGLPLDPAADDLVSFLGLDLDSAFADLRPGTDVAYSFDEPLFRATQSLPALPPLPPLPPASPAPSSTLPLPPVPTVVPKAPRSKVDGLELSNILEAGSSRARTKSSRKRAADGEDDASNRQPKKRK